MFLLLFISSSSISALLLSHRGCFPALQFVSCNVKIVLYLFGSSRLINEFE